MAILQPVQTYVVNIFPSHASSALAATNILRSVVGAVLPLGGQKLYSQLGLGWGNSVLALVTFLLIPVPLLLIFYGTRFRPTSPNNQR